ncbi:Ser/Thr and Tyr protein phosphatase [Limnobaculum zhutongyuii]|uniref:Ser/Thr and Tyr protein phosphatase n=1 Tax=Limnobaculum zhutongyuii TaxID=2498113 RepID=A0A411WLF1_9GAMM|nr:phosphatase PAP2 family protein [Limnobaculum zhutongyuii]QBH96967.1 Ser/Thr and Tyr protein phosphatase [Limnobaculum zhutongyuii]TQS87483.1 Ser/Thr and Tyr protein phosphatase [Limnobaculum zhutongyuii]
MELTAEPFTKRLKTYLIYACWVGVFFFGLYPTINWFTSTRSDFFALYLQAELAIPFIPAFVWFYLSMYLVFMLPVFFLNSRELKRLSAELILVTIIGAIIFLLFPARLGFTRQLPESDLYRGIFEYIFALDKPHNLVPSLHVAYSVTIVLAIVRHCRPLVRYSLMIWLTGLILSTVFTHQHHLLDVVSGVLLSFFTYQLMDRRYEKITDSCRDAV